MIPMSSVRIAVPTPTSFNPDYNRANLPDYHRALAEAGGEAIRVPLILSAAEIRALARSCAGVLLPGSPADVDPALYGQEPQPETAPPDPQREAVDRILMEEAARDGKPLLAICFGMQLLNVVHGGTLVQHLVPVPLNHSAGKSVAVAHSIALAPDSELARLSAATALPVNSSHHQAVGIAGAGLAVAARASEDGVVEAIETQTPNWILGVQWHPERGAASAASQAVFARLTALAREVQGSR